jgi:hypothetical protein
VVLKVKSEVNPVFAVIAIVVIVAVAGFFLWRGATGGGSNKPPGAVGNAGPFSPGGVMAGTGKGGNPNQQGH